MSLYDTVYAACASNPEKLIVTSFLPGERKAEGIIEFSARNPPLKGREG